MAMPDECNFDSATHALKLNQGSPFEGLTILTFLGKNIEVTLDFTPVHD